MILVANHIIKGQGSMLSCMRPSRPTSRTNNNISSPASAAYSLSLENTPISSAQLSPTSNLTQEYKYVVETNSFGEIRSVIQQYSSLDEHVDVEEADFSQEPLLLEKVLQPSRECIQDALSHIRLSTLTKLVSTYFEHSEHTSRLCLNLYQSVHRARQLYAPLHNLLDDLPVEFDLGSYSISTSQCKWAFDIFLQFDNVDNPFHSSESHNFDDMRGCFSQLRQQLDHRLKKSHSRVHLIRRTSTCCALCLIAAAVGVVISAIAIATHVLVALVASPVCPAILPSCPTMLTSNASKKEKAHLAQLDAAAQDAYVLHKHIDGIVCLVGLLSTTIENEKLFVRIGLARCRDRHSIEEVLKQLKRNRSRFEQQLMDVEDHLFLCFLAINQARSLLLNEIHLHNSLSADNTN